MTLTTSQFIFILIGVCWTTEKLFQIVDLIERPRRNHRRES